MWDVLVGPFTTGHDLLLALGTLVWWAFLFWVGTRAGRDWQNEIWHRWMEENWERVRHREDFTANDGPD